MWMTAEDVAFMKGEACVQPGDTEEHAMLRAEQNGYVAPGGAREAFVQGFNAGLRPVTKSQG